MRRRLWMVVTALVLVGRGPASGAPATLGQDPAEHPAAQASAALRPGEAIGSSQAGSEHRELEPLAGRFKVAVASQTTSDTPLHLTGTCENRLVLGGRALLSEWAVGEGESRLEVFTLLGYDRSKKQFFAVGFDSRRASLADLWGSYDPVSRSFILSGKQRDEATGAALVYRDLLRVLGADSHVLEVFLDVPGRPPRKVAEVRFTRQ